MRVVVVLAPQSVRRQPTIHTVMSLLHSLLGLAQDFGQFPVMYAVSLDQRRHDFGQAHEGWTKANKATA